MDAEIDKALKLLLKDAGFETEKTAAKFDDMSWSVIVSFKKDACCQSRGGWDVVEYIRKNGLLAAELINKGYYSVFTSCLQIQLPMLFLFDDGVYKRLGGKPERSGTSF